MMGKPVAESRSARKMVRKMKRVVDGSSGSKESSGDVPEDVVPQPIPDSHLQTKRERMLKKIFSKKSTDAATGVKKKTTSAVSSSGPTAKSTSKTQRGKKAPTVVVSTNDNEGEGAAPTSTRKELRSVMLAAKKQLNKEANAKIQPMQKKTSLNLSNAARHNLFVSELNTFNQVVNHPAFVADPYGSLQQHLDSTARKLQPQTPDYGRRAQPPVGASNQQQRRQVSNPPQGRQGRRQNI